ncbi:MAG: Heme chaperone HemW [Cyanobacteriota bacterium erpe_2018_sw_21hr_WHONDRS-SW48-000092_B_bin.40]|nr:Heme chaperone HemW [Cyanobacteriota bacterium erpe_2018_sw_21hr_WHONDRS-SW48-000092_B_bin.40]
MKTKPCPQSAYIHIPFCTHKCEFCDFAAFAGLIELEDEYCQILAGEIESRLGQRQEKLSLKTIFYGGGTPGLIKPSNIAMIHKQLLKFAPLQTGLEPGELEIALETTPHAITAQKAQEWLEIGINRLSIGIESLSDAELSAIGRDHSVAEAVAGIAIAHQAGFESISIDFMYGLPTQTLASWQATLDAAIELTEKYPSIQHISAYGLEIAKNSPLLSRFPRDSASYPSDDLCVEMYEALVRTLESHNYKQYEVSNFAKPGQQSQHNLTYWRNAPYFAFGVGAHRYVDGVRSANLRSLKKYMRSPLTDEVSEVIDAQTCIKEGIMLGLRLVQGIDLKQFEQDYEVDLLATQGSEIEYLCEQKLLELSDGKLKITRQGIPISNSIIGRLI